MSAEGWNHFKFEDICTKIGSGATPTGGANAYKNAGISLIRSQNVRDFSFSNEGLAFIDDEQAEKLKSVTVSSGDVLLNITGDSVARSCIVTDEVLPARVNQHVSIIRVNESLSNNKFVFYYTQHIKPYLLSLAGNGATRNALTKAMIEQLDILLPPLPEQRAIAATLSVLDDKIELNNRINKTLEEIAQALFKRWFVDFEFPDENDQPYKSSGGEMEESELGLIPKGWKVGELDQVIEIYDSQRIPLAGNVRSGRKGIYPYYGAASIMDYIDTWIFDGIYLLLAEDGSVVTANDGPVLQYAWGKFWVNNHAHVLQGKNGFSVEQLLLLLQRVNVRPYITGAVQLKINQANLKRIPVVIPTQDICLNFNKVIEKQFAMIRDNINETNILGILRDALLPKLMSGEIRVAIEEVAADV